VPAKNPKLGWTCITRIQDLLCLWPLLDAQIRVSLPDLQMSTTTECPSPFYTILSPVPYALDSMARMIFFRGPWKQHLSWIWMLNLESYYFEQKIIQTYWGGSGKTHTHKKHYPWVQLNDTEAYISSKRQTCKWLYVLIHQKKYQKACIKLCVFTSLQYFIQSLLKKYDGSIVFKVVRHLDRVI
jgi:hypothetical protein